MVGTVAFSSPGQSPIAQFSIPVAGCIGENIPLQNQSTQATRYEWDMCQGDLSLAPTGSLAGTLSGSNIPTGIDVVFDGINWYGFVTSRNSNSIIRVSMGSNLGNVQSVAVLSSVNLLNAPTDIKLASENGNWYGFILNEGTNIIRLDFGTSLTNTPTSTFLANAISSIGNQGLDVITDGFKWYVVYTVNSNVGVLRLSSLSSNTPDQLLTGSIGNNLSDIKLVRNQGSFFAYTLSTGSPGLYRLAFGADLFSSPTIKDLSSILPLSYNYFGVDSGNDAGEFHLICSTLDGTLVNVNLGPDLALDPISSIVLGNLGVFSNTVKNRLVKYKSSWFNFAVDYSSGNLAKASFPEPICEITPGVVTHQNPVLVFNGAGKKYVMLTSFSGGAFDEVSKSVVISSSAAATIDYSNQNVCSQHPVNFSVQTSQPLTAINWDFGNGTSSNLSAPTVTYASSGSYDVSMMITSSNGCSNYLKKPIIIFDQPVADFGLPAIFPICTNQNYFHPNTSTFDAGANPTWEWSLNGNLVSVQKDLVTQYSSPVSQEIRLKASIPGCSNETIKNIATVLPGPAVDFLVSDDCADDLVSFSNTTTGTVSGYAWSFGDGSPGSALPQPVHSYTSAGVFQVSLTASNLAGCQNQAVKSVTIYSLPQPDFSGGLPPFSCSNTPTPFQNNTPALTDSNITDWAWSFGDAAGSTSANQSPSFTYTAGGNYSVGLTATSDFGCAKTLTKLVAIGSSPLADFTVGPSCLNKPTAFADISSGGVQSRIWQISSSSFAVPNPTYTFTSPGNFAATLTVTGSDGCSNMVSKTITVPVAPSLAFATSNPCADQAVGFSDVTSSPADPVIGWNWNADGNSITGNPAEHIFPSSGVFNVKMTTTHASGCAYLLSNNISIHPSPTAAFIPLPDRGAAPLTVQFENASLGATQYQWIFNDKIQSSSTDPSPVYTFIDLGEYSAELTAINSFGCRDILSVPISVLVPSIDLAITDFSLVTDPVTGNLKSIVTILNNSNIPLENGEVALHLSDNAVVNETLVLNLSPGQSSTQMLSFTISPTQLDLNFVCAAVLSEKDIQQDNNKRCLSLEDGDHVFAPYPNPSSGTLQIDWISEAVGSARITVYNSMGKREYEWETPSALGLNQSVHDLAFLSTGMYYVTIQTSASVQTMRFLRL